MPQNEDDTPVEVPFAKFEGPTDPRLKGNILDPRMTGSDPDIGHHDSERPVIPSDLPPEDLARAFKRLATESASREIRSLETQRKSNLLLELVSAQIKTLGLRSPPPRGYWLLIGAVIVLTVMQGADLWFLHTIMQSLAR